MLLNTILYHVGLSFYQSGPVEFWTVGPKLTRFYLAIFVKGHFGRVFGIFLKIFWNYLQNLPLLAASIHIPIIRNGLVYVYWLRFKREVMSHTLTAWSDTENFNWSLVNSHLVNRYLRLNSLLITKNSRVKALVGQERFAASRSLYIHINAC